MSDPHALGRFIEAQSASYSTALAELRAGAKHSHWMWYVFPQLAVLGRSPTAQFFGIASSEEAQAYLADPVLGPRYLACVAALQALPDSDPVAVFGEIDAMKLRSSLTLFEAVQPDGPMGAALLRWFAGERDLLTLAALRERNSASDR